MAQTRTRPDRQPVGLSQAQQAYQLIEELIVTLTLQPGAKLSEKSLAAMVGLGRTPVREALQRLAVEGTVTIIPRAGIMISDIDITDQFRLIEVRRPLERVLMNNAARFGTEAERERFVHLAGKFMEAGAADKVDLFIPTDREFNNLALDSARNKYARLAMPAIQAQTRRFWYLYFQRYGDLARVCALHAAIANRIAAGDEAGAGKASDDLIDYVEEYTRQTLKALTDRASW